MQDNTFLAKILFQIIFRESPNIFKSSYTTYFWKSILIQDLHLG